VRNEGLCRTPACFANVRICRISIDVARISAVTWSRRPSGDVRSLCLSVRGDGDMDGRQIDWPVPGPTRSELAMAASRL
jgi:hypothetical protein